MEFGLHARPKIAKSRASRPTGGVLPFFLLMLQPTFNVITLISSKGKRQACERNSSKSNRRTLFLRVSLCPQVRALFSIARIKSHNVMINPDFAYSNTPFIKNVRQWPLAR